MKRKEINIFSTAFLDLLSGALGAVLILFIIIPKLTSEQQNALEELDRLNVQSEQLAELIELARNSIPAELYEQIQAQMRQMQNTINQLTQTVQNLQQRLQRAESENEQLREQLAQTQQQLQDARDCIRENAQLREQLAETQRQLQDAQRRLEELEPERPQTSDATGDKIFGVNAKLAVACIWSENVDVDLWVKDLRTGTTCYWDRKSTTFGILMEDIMSRSDGNDRYEIFYQSQIVPGKYEISVHLFEGRSATVDGYAVMFPATRNEQKIQFRQIRLARKDQRIIVGTLTVTENQIILEP